MEEGGFEPPKAKPADLQSVPFGHLGTPPYSIEGGAGGRIRTPDLLITNQLLYLLSYTSEWRVFHTQLCHFNRTQMFCQAFEENFLEMRGNEGDYSAAAPARGG